MGWNTKCTYGTPDGFTNMDAQNVVHNADFTKSVYVNTSAMKKETRQAYTYYNVTDTKGKTFRICVVGHIHPTAGGTPVAGNAFIPGWEAWEIQTPAAAVMVINGLKDGGAFPGDDRYPHPA